MSSRGMVNEHEPGKLLVGNWGDCKFEILPKLHSVSWVASLTSTELFVYHFGVLTEDASWFSSSMRSIYGTTVGFLLFWLWELTLEFKDDSGILFAVTLFSGVTVFDILLPVVEDTGKLDEWSSIMVQSELSSLE